MAYSLIALAAASVALAASTQHSGAAHHSTAANNARKAEAAKAAEAQWVAGFIAKHPDLAQLRPLPGARDPSGVKYYFIAGPAPDPNDPYEPKEGTMVVRRPQTGDVWIYDVETRCDITETVHVLSEIEYAPDGTVDYTADENSENPPRDKVYEGGRGSPTGALLKTLCPGMKLVPHDSDD